MATSEPKKVSSYQRIKSKFAEAIKGLEAQKKLSNEYLEKLQWAQSELENLRKCFEKERENYLRTATDKLILELLPVLDGFDRIITNPVGIERKALEGLELLYKELLGVLGKAGLAPVKAVGEKFDPFMHEAVMQVVDNNWEDNTVVEELQKGYTLNSRVLRASKVKVSKRG